jgi:hypothetical protein
MLEAIGTYTNGTPFDLFPTELGSPSHQSFVYMAYAGALPDPPGGSGVFDVYRAERTSTRWQTRRFLTPTEGTLHWPVPGGIASDHSYAFVNVRSFDGSIQFTDYLQNSLGDWELTGVGRLGSEPNAQGRYISPGGEHVIFTTGDNPASAWCTPSCAVLQLEPNAPPSGTAAVYDRAADGGTRVISLLPDNSPLGAGEDAFYKGASADGSVVAFTVDKTIYARVDNAKTEEVASGEATYAGISDDGVYLFYVSAGTIHRFDTDSETDLPVNPSGEGQIVNVSADGSHVYFISKSEINGEGIVGEPNMFVWSGGSPEYVTTVAPSDLERTSGSLNGLPALTNWTGWVANQPPEGFQQGPGADSSRSTADGDVLVFESKAQLTPYVNAERTEIYRYVDSTGGLSCVSCNPHAQPPTEDARLQELHLVGAPFVIHNVTDDGSRVFFETPEALLERDSDGINDIYEWQEGEGPGSLGLITSGQSLEYPPPKDSPFDPLPNLLLSATPDGVDVFFTAKEALVPGAGEAGTQAIYDARSDGGFPLPSTPTVCLEEECRLPASSSSPSSNPPESEASFGSGNVKRKKRRCRRQNGAKHAKHRSCARRHKKASESSALSGSSAQVEGAGGSASPDLTEQGRQPRSTAPVSLIGGESEEFGIESLEAKLSNTVAGMHPDLTSTFEFTTFKLKGGQETASANAEDISVTLPPGLLGNPTATRTCSMGDFASFGNCPIDAQVGITRIRVGDPLFTTSVEPVYNLAPPHPDEELARLGFIAYLYPVYLDIKVHTAGDYEVTATVHKAPGLGSVIRSKTTLWGDPASTVHDKERSTPAEAFLGLEGEHASGIPLNLRKSFMTNPSACKDGQVGLEVVTYQLPDRIFTASAPLAPITNCQGLPFAPTFNAEPTNHTAGAPTGLKTKLVLPQHLMAEELATATMREARVTLPEGMQIAAGAANWIGTCSEAQVGFHEEVDTACPDNSKLGTARIISPALSTPIEGTLYQRNPQPGHQFGLWLTADALGMHIKLPGELAPDKTTGRLTAVFHDLPQVPVEEIDLNVWGGPRAPLQNPDHCGTFTTDFSFAPHSEDPAATGQSTMQITEGCNHGFSPTLHAGVTDPVAGRFSPFVVDLTRDDGSQALRGFELHLPDGELAKLKGVPLCPDAAAGAGSCPAGSRIGSLQATTGPGPDPLTIPQPGRPEPQIYLAGPYQGASFSIVSEVPAQAGPFDLGTLAVRSGLAVDPETARATVKADPLPQFFEGVGIAYRRLHAVIDRPGFALNPTDCREMAVTSELTSTQGAVAHPSARFQVDGCKRLKFKPKLQLRLKGGTRRADYPALTAVLKARKGDANIAFTSVALPHSEFLAQEHIGTICTRVQFAADECPKRSVYGKAKATTPLLDKPLQGTVYLRSSNHRLPDLVVALRGQLEIELVGRIDSKNGGIRTTFDTVPDAPVSKFVLQMKGGAKGLLVNSTDICRGAHRATVAMRGQNGRAAQLRPPLQSSGCPKKKLGQHKKHH